MTSEKDYYIDFNAQKHGYHRYTAVFGNYEDGYSPQVTKMMNNLKVEPELDWFVVHYADLHGGHLSDETCHSFEQAIEMVKKKPKKSNVAYQWWKDVGRLYTKPTGRGAVWSNEQTKRFPHAGHLFVCGYKTNVEIDGRTLILMRNVNTGRGIINKKCSSDGHHEFDLEDENEALK